MDKAPATNVLEVLNCSYLVGHIATSNTAVKCCYFVWRLVSIFNGHFVRSFSHDNRAFWGKKFLPKNFFQKFCPTKFLPIIFYHIIPGNANFYSSHTPLLQSIIFSLPNICFWLEYGFQPAASWCFYTFGQPVSSESGT